MRALILITVFLITIFPANAMLEDYPNFLFDDGEFNAKIVVGEEAPSMDVTSAIELIPSLQELSEERIRGSMLDSQVTEYTLQKYSIISIGCENEITKQIMGIKDCSGFVDGEGNIYYYESPLGKSWVVIAGGLPRDTQKAARVLGNYEDYELQGNAVKVTGAVEYEVEQIKVLDAYEGKETDEAKELPETKEKEENDKNTEEDRPKPVLYEKIEEPEKREGNPVEKLQQELDKEINEIEEKDEATKPTEDKPPAVDPQAPLHKIVWVRFKHWFSWFFR